MTKKTSPDEQPFVYDKAKYHYGADDFPSSFPATQAYVHTGVNEMVTPTLQAVTL